MAYLFQPDYVRYACSCGSLKPISRIYFCRHCLKIRCGYCVAHEVILFITNINLLTSFHKLNKLTSCYNPIFF